MREAVLDIGSNTGHLLVVDAHRGAAPLPASSTKEPLRLAEHLTPDGALSDDGHRRAASPSSSGRWSRPRTRAASRCSRSRPRRSARRATPTRCSRTVIHETNVDLTILAGEDEARLTFLAVRRWFGWSSGRLAVFDIGGGSLEVAAGSDERPDVAVSFELGAGRLTRNWLPDDIPTEEQFRALRKYVRAEIAREAGSLLRMGVGDHTVATSKTFRSLARMCGAAAVGRGPVRPPRAAAQGPQEDAAEGRVDVEGRAGQAARRLGRPRPPDGRRRASSPRRRWTCSTSTRSRSAPGRCARASSCRSST